MTKFYTCWYCGYHSELLIDFRYLTKKGMSYKMFQCPSCKHIYRKNTMALNFQVRDWCKYLYLGIRIFKRDNFFEKVKFEKLFINLKSLGINGLFWDVWNQVKEEYKETPAPDMLNEWFDMIDRATPDKPKQLKINELFSKV